MENVNVTQQSNYDLEKSAEVHTQARREAVCRHDLSEEKFGLKMKRTNELNTHSISQGQCLKRASFLFIYS